jgi:hypothetical protein
MFDEGTSDVSVGSALAIMVDSKNDVEAFKNFKNSGEQ